MGDKVKSIANFRTTALKNVAEIVFNVADENENPVIDFEERNFDEATLQIWTGTGYTGTLLIEDTDYVLTNKNLAASSKVSKNIYNGISIVNPVYQGVDLYIPVDTLSTFGDMLDETDINRLQTQINELISGTAQVNIGTRIVSAIDNNPALLSAGFAQCALDNGISQSVFSTLFAEIGHMWNDLHVMAGDADLSDDVAGLFYPTPPPTDDGWLEVWGPAKGDSVTAFPLTVDLSDGRYSVEYYGISNPSVELVRVELVIDTSTGKTHFHSPNFASTSDYEFAWYDSSVGQLKRTASSGYNNGSLVYRITKFAPETMSKAGAYAYYKIDSVTPSGSLVSALRYSTGWVEQTGWENVLLSVDHNLDADISDLDVEVWLSVTGSDSDAFKVESVSYELSASPAASQVYGYQVQASSANQLKIQTGKTGIGYIAVTGSLGAFTTGTAYYKVIVTKPELIATVSDVPYEVTISDAVDVDVTLPDPSSMVGESIYRRKGAGTGKLTLTCPSGVKLVLLDDTELDSIDLEGKATLIIYPSGGNLYVKHFLDILTPADSAQDSNRVIKKYGDRIVIAKGYSSATVAIDNPSIGMYVSDDITVQVGYTLAEAVTYGLALGDDPSAGGYRIVEGSGTTSALAFQGIRGSSASSAEISFNWEIDGVWV